MSNGPIYENCEVVDGQLRYIDPSKPFNVTIRTRDPNSLPLRFNGSDINEAIQATELHDLHAMVQALTERVTALEKQRINGMIAATNVATEQSKQWQCEVLIIQKADGSDVPLALAPLARREYGIPAGYKQVGRVGYEEGSKLGNVTTTIAPLIEPPSGRPAGTSHSLGSA